MCTPHNHDIIHWVYLLSCGCYRLVSAASAHPTGESIPILVPRMWKGNQVVSFALVYYVFAPRTLVNYSQSHIIICCAIPWVMTAARRFYIGISKGGVQFYIALDALGVMANTTTRRSTFLLQIRPWNSTFALYNAPGIYRKLIQSIFIRLRSDYCTQNVIIRCRCGSGWINRPLKVHMEW